MVNERAVVSVFFKAVFVVGVIDYNRKGSFRINQLETAGYPAASVKTGGDDFRSQSHGEDRRNGRAVHFQGCRRQADVT